MGIGRIRRTGPGADGPGAAEAQGSRDYLGLLFQSGARGSRGQGTGGQGLRHLADFLSDPEVQVVYISTPHALHTPQAYKALEAGKSVLVEKPIALSADGVHKLTEVAHRKKVTLGTSFPLRHHPGLKELKDDLTKGAFGDLIHIYVLLSREKQMDKPWWKDQFHSGPMCLMDLGLQGIDLMIWLAGTKPVEVSTVGKGGQSDDSLNIAATISVNFDSGATGAISASNMVKGDRNLVLLQGSEKQALVEMNWPEGDGAFQIRMRPAGKDEEKKYEPVNLYKLLAENFNQAVLGKETYSPTPEESYPVVEVCCAAIESLKSGRAVRVGQVQRVTGPRFKD